MTTVQELPQTFLEMLEYHGIQFRGWYAEPVEGIRAPYACTLEETLEFMQEVQA